MKRIRFNPDVPAQVRAIPKLQALKILQAIHLYAENGFPPLKPLKGEWEGILRLRVGDYRVLLSETDEAIQVHRVGHRGEVYR